MTRAVPAIWFLGFLFDVLASLRSSGSRRPRLLSKAVHPLTGFDPSSETPSSAALFLFRRRTVDSCIRAPPMRFFAPSAVVRSANRLLSGSTQTPSLFDLSQVLEGFILAKRCRLVSSCCRSWGSSPSELFPTARLCRARHPVIPSRRFVLRPVVDGCAPRGLRRSAVRHPTQEYCILCQAAALMGFQSSSRRSCVPGWIRLSTFHPLLAFSSSPYGTSSKLAFSVFYP